ncbi:histidine kinase [Leifsonia sp. H3M29-4]|uniref:sensor histidine kinase n=1 Tax=Salinibacterium metalliresistens TaxID=3031321 RepID=UPI0023DCAD8B|nr:histidine kinase [Salinibacterium metalliresistens]MDF1478340.1 histidine kinase [Salinibacterium metalliresistens]
MTARRVRLGIAIAVWATSWGLAIASLIIAWVFQLPQLPLDGVFLSKSPLIVQSRFDDIGLIVALIYGPLSAALIALRPHPVATLLAVHAVGSGIAAFGVQYGLLGEVVPDLPAWGFVAYAAGWGFLPGTVSTTIIPLLISREPLSMLHRVLVGVGIGLAGAALLLAFTVQAPGGPVNPFALPIAAYQAAAQDLYAIIVTAALTLSTVTAVILFRRWLRTPSTQRAALGWLVIGHTFLTLSYGALVLPEAGDMPAVVWQFGMIAPVIGQIFYPAAVLVMVLDQRLWGIDLAVNRVLVWSILTVGAVGGYLVIVSLLADLEWSPQVTGIAAAAIVAVAIQPVRIWLQRGVNRLLYEEGAAPTDLVRAIGSRVGELDSGVAGLGSLVTALAESLRLSSLAVVSVDPGGPAACTGTPNGAVTRVELRAGAAVIGWMDATARAQRRLSRSTRRSLEEFAGVISAALQLVVASGRLERLRDEVLSARQEERRQLRRELHDGIGPALAGIGFGLAAVDNMIAANPAGARALLERLGADVRERLADVRELARSMRPASASFDLAAELEELAADFSGAGPFITVGAPAATDLGAEQAAAAYLIAAEAVHNAVRHAAADRIDIELDSDEGVVLLTIADDGDGFVVNGGEGVGLASMRERAAAAGASFEIRSSGSGTTVQVRFVGADAMMGARTGEAR